MMDWALDTNYRHLHHVHRRAERALLVYFNSESRLLDLMQRIEQAYDRIRVFSLPSSAGTSVRPHIELGVRGEPAQVEAAIHDMRDDLSRRGIEWEAKS
jgi:molybdopterin-biosynthesis enzyme MoeA-like protein